MLISDQLRVGIFKEPRAPRMRLTSADQSEADKIGFIQIQPVTYFWVSSLSFARLLVDRPRSLQNVYGFLNKAFKITAKAIEKLFRFFCFAQPKSEVYDRSFCGVAGGECDKTTVAMS